jgi:hypothetical protein
MPEGFVFNVPPNWPEPPPGWEPPANWVPDPAFPPPPPGWVFWLPTPVPPAPTPPSTISSTLSDVERLGAALAEDQVVSTQSAGCSAPPNGPIASAHQERKPEEGRPCPEDLVAQLEILKAELTSAHTELARLANQQTISSAAGIVDLSDERILQEVGIYRYHHPLENSEEYRDQIGALQERIKDSVKSGHAILVSNMFTFDNSLAKGRKMTSDFSKLMLRAYNSEADNCVRSLRAGNVITAKNRLEASVTSIARLGAMMEMAVSPAYHAMRIEEIELTADFLMKVQEERERAREERERLREERKVAQELAAERERLDKERSHYEHAIQALRSGGDEAGIEELIEKLHGVDEAIAHNDYRAANIRAGYVYVISNEGAFGKNVVKIGLTRRIEPLDRVRELGGASVPFPFDVHALFFSDDAVSLETELHHYFAERRVNHVNERREFFFANPHEVRIALAEKVGNLLEFTEEPEATQFRQSKGLWPGERQSVLSSRYSA